MQYITDKTMVNGKTCVQFKPRTSQTAYIRFVEGTGYNSCTVFLKTMCFKRVHCPIVANHGKHRRFYSRVESSFFYTSKVFFRLKMPASPIIFMFNNFHFLTFTQMSHKHRICRKGKGLDAVRWVLLKGTSNARTFAYSWILARTESIRQRQLRQNTYGQCPIRSNIVYY